jgi:hypothetical protein
MFALKGKQGGMVQQQIEVMGLRQWLFFVAAWTTERVFSAVVTDRDLTTPSSPALGLEHGGAKIAVLTPDLSFLAPASGKLDRSLCARSSKLARQQSVPKATALNKSEFNVLKPNLIVTAMHRLMFDLDEETYAVAADEIVTI